jgi:hypothetical protein
LHQIRQIQLDFVTFGAPVRYSWGKYPQFRLMPIINHRDQTGLTGLLTGLLITYDGDYVQQWGGPGTDAWPPSNVMYNDQFDNVLDQGRAQFPNVANFLPGDRRQAIYADGVLVANNVLVDYADNAYPMPFPNFGATLFGHGAYTKENAMLFNINFIIEHWYR